MKKKLMSGIVLATMLNTLMPCTALAESLTWTAESKMLTVDADTYYVDSEVFVNERSIVMVPVRAVVEKMNGTAEYFVDENRVHVELKDSWADIFIGEEVTDETIQEAPIGKFGNERHDIATIKNDCLYLPAYLLAYALQADMHIIYDEQGAPYRVFFYVPA